MLPCRKVRFHSRRIYVYQLCSQDQPAVIMRTVAGNCNSRAFSRPSTAHTNMLHLPTLNGFYLPAPLTDPFLRVCEAGVRGGELYPAPTSALTISACSNWSARWRAVECLLQHESTSARTITPEPLSATIYHVSAVQVMENNGNPSSSSVRQQYKAVLLTIALEEKLRREHVSVPRCFMEGSKALLRPAVAQISHVHVNISVDGKTMLCVAGGLAGKYLALRSAPAATSTSRHSLCPSSTTRCSAVSSS